MVTIYYKPAPTSEPAPTSSPFGESFPCPHSDPEQLHKLAQSLLPSLSAACIDSTTGDPFRSSASVAVDLRHSLVNYVSQCSLTFLLETLSLLANNPNPSSYLPNLDDPIDILSFLLEEFVSSIRNLLCRVSIWLSLTLTMTRSTTSSRSLSPPPSGPSTATSSSAATYPHASSSSPSPTLLLPA